MRNNYYKLHSLEELQNNYNLLLKDFDSLYKYVEILNNREEYQKYGLEILERYKIVNKYFTKNYLLTELYKELYTRWQINNSIINPK